MDEHLSMDQVFIKKLTDIVLANLANENFGVEELIIQAGMSRSSIHRKLRSITHQSVSQFIRETRLQRALEMLQSNVGTVSEISYMTGFGSPTYFNKCFHEFFGYPPGQVKKGDFNNNENNILNNVFEKHEKKRLARRTFTLAISGILILASLVLFFIYPGYIIIPNSSAPENLKLKDKRKTVVVTPFQNMTGDSTKNYLRTLIQDNLVTNLSYFPEELTVRQTESVNYLIQSKSITNDDLFVSNNAGLISKKLDADFIINGRIGKVGPIRIYAQLIDSKTGEIIQSFEKEASSWEELTFRFIDAFSEQVKNFLIISVLKKNIYSGIQKFASTDSLNAYKAFLNGQMAYFKADYRTAIENYLNALEVDSGFVAAAVMLTLSYSNLGQRDDSKYFCDQARYWCDKAYSKRSQISEHQMILANYAHALIYESPYERIKYVNQLLEFDSQLPNFIYNKGLFYNALHQYERAIPEFNKVLQIYKKWGVKPERSSYITQLGIAYHETGEYRKEQRLYKNADSYFPDNQYIIRRQAILFLTVGNIVSANHVIEKYIKILKDNSESDAAIAAKLGEIYSGAHLLDKAEEYYTQALNLEPESHTRLNSFAWFLIDKDKDIIKGLEYVEKALELSPDNHFYLDCKGWGLYKLGKFQEALDVLNKSWDLRPLYRYAVYQHLEAAKKAFADQKLSIE